MTLNIESYTDLLSSPPTPSLPHSLPLAIGQFKLNIIGNKGDSLCLYMCTSHLCHLLAYVP